tara:strand:- start:1154 stop:1849 length:696 start_codon:yes stop_codon:yes gene_type:complete
MPKLTKNELYRIVRGAMAESNLIKEMSSYNRVRDHIEGGSSFVLMSSDRHERSNAENRKMYQDLKRSFASAGFSFTEVKGGFKETTKMETDPETGEEVEVELEEPIHVTENSLLVTTHPRGEEAESNDGEALFDFARQMAQQYQQEAFIFGEAGTTASGKQIKVINAYDKDGSAIQEDWAGPWGSVETVTKDADFWSRASGKHFQLKENKKTSQPKSWFEAMRKSKQGLKW